MKISGNAINLLISRVFVVLLGLVSFNLHADVQVENPWVRLLPPTSKMTAAYMSLKSDRDDRLVGVSSDSASVVEIHLSKMEDGVMSMREISCLELPANKTVELKPQSYHLMVMGLKTPLKAGQVHHFVLEFEVAGKLEVAVPVRDGVH